MTGDDVPPTGTPRERGTPGDGSAVDELLDGRRRPETEDDMTLDRLLSALRAPGTADELRGLDTTTAAFVAARAEGARSADVVPFPGRTRRRAATVGVAAVALCALLGGVAAAAVGGHLPDPLQQLAANVAPGSVPAPGDDDSRSGGEAQRLG